MLSYDWCLCQCPAITVHKSLQTDFSLVHPLYRCQNLTYIIKTRKQLLPKGFMWILAEIFPVIFRMNGAFAKISMHEFLPLICPKYDIIWTQHRRNDLQTHLFTTTPIGFFFILLSVRFYSPLWWPFFKDDLKNNFLLSVTVNSFFKGNLYIMR